MLALSPGLASPLNPQTGRSRHVVRTCGPADTSPGPGSEGGMGRGTEVEGIRPEWRG